MAGFRLTAEADADLDGIAAFTRARWDDLQAEHYLRGLDRDFHALAAMPGMGTAREEIAPGLRVHPYESHRIFYEVEPDGGVLIVRVLHKSMLPVRHFGGAARDEGDE